MTYRLARSSALALGLALTAVVAGGAAARESIAFSDDTLQGWGALHQEGLMGGYSATLSEYVPPDESVETWTRMVTVISYDMRGEKQRVGPADLYASMRDQYRARCRQSSVSEPEQRQADADPATFFIMACDAAPDGPTAGSGDWTAVLLVETRDAFHVVQRAWRGALPDPEQRPISDQELADWMSFFDSVRVVRGGAR